MTISKANPMMLLRNIFLQMIPLMILMNPFGAFAQEGAGSPDDLGELFLRSVAERKFRILMPVLPGVEQWKKLSPDQTKGLSDQEIGDEIRHGNIPALESAYHHIIHAATRGGFQVKEISFNDVVVQRYSDSKNIPVGLEVLFFYDHYHDKFHLTAVELDGRWYLLGIREPDVAFSQVRKIE